MLLDKEYFHQDTLSLARDLLGKVLCAADSDTGNVIWGIINETEAYHGYEDDASHGYKKRTLRNIYMYETVGHAYVYFVYGMHFMFNITAFEEGFPAAVLIRSVLVPQDEKSRDLIAFNRFKLPYAELSVYQKKNLTNGPAKVAAAFTIDKRFNGLPLNKTSGIWIEDRGVLVSDDLVKATPRIGIDYATNSKLWPWRFVY